MPKASELKKGAVVDIDGQLYVARNIDVRSPSSRGANTLYKIRFSNIQTGQKLEQTCKGDDMLKDVELIRRPVQFSYRDGEQLVFMDNEDYSQYTMSESDLAEEQPYITEATEGMLVSLVDEQVVALELPQVVELEITDTAPGIKGASASARTKPATLSTGLEVQVPEYLETGETIKVNTRDKSFISRA